MPQTRVTLDSPLRRRSLRSNGPSSSVTPLPSPSPRKRIRSVIQRRRSPSVESQASESDLPETPSRKRTGIPIEITSPSRKSKRYKRLEPESSASSFASYATEESEGTEAADDTIVDASNDDATEDASPRYPSILPSYLYPSFQSQKRAVLNALQCPPYPEEDEVGRTSTMAQLSELMERTIQRGEGNSCILLGPKGCGKTRAINETLNELSTKPIMIRLSGHVHLNDRMAMKEIVRQVQGQLGSKWGDNIMDNNEEEEVEDAILSTLPPNSHLPALITSLPSLPKPTILILDAFDLFTSHPRQALLYCLLDTVQSLRAGVDSSGVAVIGVTTRLDVLTLLEKRVKSRFSHRVLRLTPPRSVDEYLSILRQALTTPIPDTSSEWVEYWNSSIEYYLTRRHFLSWLSGTLNLVHDVGLVCKVVTSLVLGLNYDSPWLKDPPPARPRSNHDLSALTYPGLCLLLAAYDQQAAGFEIFTFAMLEHAFESQVRISSAAPVTVAGASIGMVRCSYNVLLCTFEKMVKLKIFISAAPASAGTQKQFAKYRSTVERADLKWVIEKSGQTTLKKWFTQSYSHL